VIEELADNEVARREANRQLVALVADLAYEKAVLECAYERKWLSWLHGDALIVRLQRLLHRSAA
jgi:hypothetical protein